MGFPRESRCSKKRRLWKEQQDILDKEGPTRERRLKRERELSQKLKHVKRWLKVK